MAKLSDNDIVQLVKDTQMILSDPAGAPDASVKELNWKNLEQEPVFDVYYSEAIITSPGQIVEPAVFNKFERLTVELIRSDNSEEAFKLTVLLEYLLNKFNSNLRLQDPVLYQKYEKLLGLARYVSIISLNIDEIEKLVGNYTAYAIMKKVDVQRKLNAVLWHYDDIMMEGAIAEKIANALVSSKEPLGRFSIILSDRKNYPPTVGNWLKDYIQFALTVADRQTGPYARSQYVFNDKNYRNLGGNEKVIVESLLKLFDWLKYGEGIPAEDIQDEDNIIEQKAELPGLTQDMNQESPVAEEKFVTGQAGIRNQAGQVLPAAMPKAGVRPAVPAAPPGARKAEKVVRQAEDDLALGKGLKLAGMNHEFEMANQARQIKPPAPLPPKPQSGIMNNELRIMDKKKQEIDRKLEELKKKAQSKNQEL